MNYKVLHRCLSRSKVPIGIGALYTSRNASLSLAGRRVALLCAPFQIQGWRAHRAALQVPPVQVPRLPRRRSGVHAAVGMLSLLVPAALALNNGLGRTPARGWNAWNSIRCEGLNENLIREVADAMVR